MRYNNIGIKHSFLCIKICWAPRMVLNAEHVKQGFDNLQGPRRCLCSSKAYFIAIIRLFISHFCWKSFDKKRFENFSFCITYLNARKHCEIYKGKINA